MSRPYSELSGVVLAGGQSRRFGRNKALCHYQSVPMVVRMVRTLRSCCEEIHLVTNRPSDYQDFGFKVIQDETPGLGPLGGIVTAMKHSDKKWFFVIPCDLPLLTEEVVETILSEREGWDAVIPRTPTRTHYLPALYSRELLQGMEAFLRQGIRSLKAFAKTIERVHWLDVEEAPFFNMNTQEDLQNLESTFA